MNVGETTVNHIYSTPISIKVDLTIEKTELMHSNDLLISDLQIIAFYCAFPTIIESGIFHKASSLDHRTPTQILRRFLVLVWRKFYKEVFVSEFSVHFKHLEI